MAAYGKYDIVNYPSFHVVTNMQTHEWAAKPTTDIHKARRTAQRLQKADQRKAQSPLGS